MVMVIKASSAMANNVSPIEESLEWRAILPNFHEWTLRCRHGSTLWLMPYLTRSFFSVMNVPSITVRATVVWYSGQKIIPFSCRSWYMLHQLWHEDYLLGLYFSNNVMDMAFLSAVLEMWLDLGPRNRGLR
jgi:hypothetical protein